ncbi:MAG: hypothetical protein KatS3mg111_0971 [Pirellulaceae bacterium]|nr:MAG: hypothetical protein KatS3mg111_0971 [Pirellulaceae bacterium]
MDQHWVFDDVAEVDRQTARNRWDEKARPILKLLRSYEPDKLSLRLTLSHIERGNQWQLRAVLLLPTGTLVAESTKKSLEEAIDDVAATLRREVKKHKELVRRDYIVRRRIDRRANLSAAGSYLDADVEHRRREAFFRLLKPMISDLKKEVGRQLRFLRDEGLLREHGLTADDVIDDVLVAAWEQYSERPKKIDLHLWLAQLAQQRLRRACHEPVEEVLSEAVEPKPIDEPLTPEEDVDEPDYWLERFETSYFESALEDFLVDPESAQWWENLSEEERQSRFQKALAALPEEQRDAIWLSIIAGYDLDEVAVIVGEDPGKLKSLIEEATQTLRQRIQAEASTPVGG